MPFSSRFDPAIASFVKAQAFAQIGDWESQSYHKRTWDEQLSDARVMADDLAGSGLHVEPRETY
jgi:hypothetical protein